MTGVQTCALPILSDKATTADNSEFLHISVSILDHYAGKRARLSETYVRAFDFTAVVLPHTAVPTPFLSTDSAIKRLVCQEAFKLELGHERNRVSQEKSDSKRTK